MVPAMDGMGESATMILPMPRHLDGGSLAASARECPLWVDSGRSMSAAGAPKTGSQLWRPRTGSGSNTSGTDRLGLLRATDLAWSGVRLRKSTVPPSFRITVSLRTICRNRRIPGQFRACSVSIGAGETLRTGKIHKVQTSVSISNDATPLRPGTGGWS